MSGGPGPLDGTIINTNFEETTGNNVVLNNLFMMIDASAATNTGHWVSFVPFKGGTLEVTGANSPTFSLQVYGSNSPTQPADTFDGSPIGSAITTPGLTQIVSAPRWVKTKLTSISGASASVTAILNAFSP